jgi:flagellar motor switch protein FliN
MAGEKDTELLEETANASTDTTSPVAEQDNRSKPAGGGADTLAAELAEHAADAQNLDMLLDVNLKLTVELGRARMKFRDILNLSTGSVVELTRLTSEPVDLLVNGAVFATGEVVVVDDHFAVRINKLLNRVERLKRVI